MEHSVYEFCTVSYVFIMKCCSNEDVIEAYNLRAKIYKSFPFPLRLRSNFKKNTRWKKLSTYGVESEHKHVGSICLETRRSDYCIYFKMSVEAFRMGNEMNDIILNQLKAQKVCFSS